MSISFLLATALVLGMRHALEPDHLVAVSTLVAEERRLWPAARLGLIWGLGHQLPLTILGVLVLVFRLRLPASMEHLVDLGVGLILVILGLRTCLRLWRERVHVHSHAHDGHAHVHFHAHGHSHRHEHHSGVGSERQGVLSFGIGLMHGLGGSGAAAILALSAAPSAASGVGYLLLFGTGVCIGMFALTSTILAPTVSTAARFGPVHGALRGLAAISSIALGVFMCTSILSRLLG